MGDNDGFVDEDFFRINCFNRIVDIAPVKIWQLMLQELFTNFAIVSIENDLANDLDYNEVNANLASIEASDAVADWAGGTGRDFSPGQWEISPLADVHLRNMHGNFLLCQLNSKNISINEY